MAATCAGCDGPITRGDGFKLVGTEVFHSSCVRWAVSASKLARTLRELRDSHAESTRLHRKAQDLARDLEEVKAREERMSDGYVTAKGRINTLEGQRAYDSLRISQLEQENNRLRAELDQARRAALAAPVLHAPIATPEIPSTPKSDKDDTEQRFALLELDLP